MSLLLGTGLLSVGLVLFAYGYRAARRPVPARWTEGGVIGALVPLVMTIMFGWGLTLVIGALWTPGLLSETGISGLAGAVAMAALAVVVSLWLVRVPAASATPETPEQGRAANADAKPAARGRAGGKRAA